MDMQQAALSALQWAGQHVRPLLGGDGRALTLAVHTFITADLPSILRSAAQALERAPVAASPQQWKALNASEGLVLAPILTCLLVVVVLPLCITNSAASSTQDGGRESYWLTRMLIVRVMGVIYFCAFLVSAFQARCVTYSPVCMAHW
jgi:hypothetical protein